MAYIGKLPLGSGPTDIVAHNSIYIHTRIIHNTVLCRRESAFQKHYTLRILYPMHRYTHR